MREPEAVCPDDYLSVSAEGVFSDEAWWPAFGDTTLNRFMNEAFKGNPSLQQVAARLDQFRAAYTAARATWFPVLNAQGSVTESGNVVDPEPPTTTVPNTAAVPSTMTTPKYSAGFAAAYELDLWGKLAAGRGASLADRRAGEEDLRTAALVLAAQVVRTYYRIVELLLQEDLLEETVASYENYHELVLDRYSRGVTPSLDVYQAETSLAGARAGLDLVRINLASIEYQFAVLLGRYPERGLVPEGADMPGQWQPIPAGLPSGLVKRRPDVRAAYWRLVAADRRAAEAVASRFPSFSLTGSVGGASDELGKAVDPDNMIWTAVGNLALPLFQGGRLKGNAERAEAAWRGQVEAYRATVLGSFQEVESSLVAIEKRSERARHLETQTAAAEATLRLATDRYLRGVSDYLPVVMAQTSFLNASRGWITARREFLDERVYLLTALGGSWTDAIIERNYPD